jgi:hypothetical protein
MPWIKVPKLSGSHPLVVSNAVQVRLRWSLNGKLVSNVLGGQVGGGYANSQAHANALGTAVIGRFTSSGLKALSASTTEMLGVGIRDVRTPNQVEYLSVAAGVIGTGAGDPLPNELAAVATLKTALAGKHYRGRVYIGGANEAQNDAAGQIVAAYNTAVVAFITGVSADMGTEGITLAVLARPNYLNLVPPADVQTYAGAITPVTSISALDTVWDSQRRRGR